MALADKPAVPFRVPAGIKLIRIDARTGMRVGPGGEGGVILEAFKPGTAPPDSYSVIGYTRTPARIPGQQDSGRRGGEPGYVAPQPTGRSARAPAGCTDATMRAAISTFPTSWCARSCGR